MVFFFGVFFKRLNARGCLAALLVGFALGVFRLAIDTPVALGIGGFEEGYTQGSFLWVMNSIYFQYYSLLIFLVSATVMVVVSLMSEAPDPAQIQGITFGCGQQRRSSQNPRKLGLARCRGQCPRTDRHSCGLSLFFGIRAPCSAEL